MLRERNSSDQTCFKGFNMPKEINKFPTSKNTILKLRNKRNRNSFLIFITFIKSVHDPKIILLILSIDHLKNLLSYKLIIPVNQNHNRVIATKTEGSIDNVIGCKIVLFVSNEGHFFGWKFKDRYQIVFSLH